MLFDGRGHLPASKTDHRENRLSRKARAKLEPDQPSMPPESSARNDVGGVA
jgi:hypothetical protein